MLQCKICGSFLDGSDHHDKCIVHRQCSRNSPCPLDESQDTKYWDEVESIRAAALGVRCTTDVRKKSATSKVSAKVRKGKKVERGSLPRGADPAGPIKSGPAASNPSKDSSGVALEVIPGGITSAASVINESNQAATQAVSIASVGGAVYKINKAPDTMSGSQGNKPGTPGLNNPDSRGANIAPIMTHSVQQGSRGATPSEPVSYKANVQEPRGATPELIVTYQKPLGVSESANYQVPRGEFPRESASIQASGNEPRVIIPGPVTMSQQAPIVVQPTASAVNTAAVDNVIYTLNGQRPSPGIVNNTNPLTAVPQQQWLPSPANNIQAAQARGINAAMPYPFQGMDESSARNMCAQNPLWQGFCNPFFNPFVMAAQSGFQAFPSGTQNSVNLNTDRSESPVTSVVSVVTSQPAATVTRPSAHSSMARHSQPNRSIQPTRRTPAAVVSDPYEQDSDSESESDQEELDTRSVVSASDHTFDQDQFGMDHNEQSESISIQKLSELFAATRVNPILQAARDEFGLQVEDEDEGDLSCSLRFGGVGIDRNTADPVMVMPNDIYRERDSLAKVKWRSYPNKVLLDAFKVPLSDHKALFCPPPLDKEVEEVLPGMGKGSNKQTQQPQFFSPYWEKELCHIDNHMRLLTRLASFQLTIVNYLLTTVDTETDDSPTSVAAIATLVNDMTAQQLKAALSLSMRTVTLRRENILAYLRRVYVNELPSDLRKLPFSEEFLFGSAFGKTVRSLAKKLKDKKSLQVNLKPLSSSKKKPKGNSGASKRNQDASSRGRGGYRGRSRGGKRRNSFRTPSSAAGGPSKAKKPRTGGSQQSL